MNTHRTKIFAIILFAIPLLLLSVFSVTPNTVTAARADDAATTYKTKCAACHTATAAKFFDATKADADLVQTTMQGRKGDKPPFMPGYEAKGMTSDEAQGLVAYMKTLRATK